MRVSLLFSLVATILSALCLPLPAHAEPPDDRTPAARCAALAGKRVPQDAIGWPTRGAEIVSATMVGPAAGLPDYCRIVGKVLAVTKTGISYRFQLDMPTRWNGKAIQLGGGGVNGVLIDPARRPTVTAPDVPPPLARGYAVFASDGGHSAPDGSFAMDPETLINFGWQELNKTRDAVRAIIMLHDHTAWSRLYFIGFSEGGREALLLAQRFGQYYDGIIAGAPVYALQAEELGNLEMMKHLYAPGGWIDPTRTAALVRTVYDQCDRLDGLVDGIITAPQLCHPSLASLRCAAGQTPQATCFSDAQIRAVAAIAHRVDFPFTLNNGVRSYEGYPILEGGTFTTFTLGKRPQPGTPASFKEDAALYAFADPVLRYQIVRQKAAHLLDIDIAHYAEAATRMSVMTDATSTDIGSLTRHGGKLLLTHGLADTAVSYRNTVRYYQGLVERYGTDTLDKSVRFYLIPGFDHGVGRFKAGWDDLSALEEWVERGHPPQDAVIGDYQDGLSARRRLPLCPYPKWAHYRGGPADSAASFICAD